MNSKVLRTKNNRAMLISKYAVCSSKNSRFVKEQKVKRLLSSLVQNTSLNKIPLLGEKFFKKFIWNEWNSK